MSRGQTLAVLLVAVLVIAIVVVFMMFSRQASTPQQKGQQAQTTYGVALQRAKEVDCMNNLRQIRMSVQQSVAETGTTPTTLQAVRLPKGLQIVCPVTKAPYTYDPNTGTVRCPQHQRL